MPHRVPGRGRVVLVGVLALLVVGAAGGVAAAEPQPSPGPTPPAAEVESAPDEPSPSPGASPAPDGPPQPVEEPSEPEPSPGPTPPAHEVVDGIPAESGGGGLFGLLDIPGAIADAMTAAVTGFVGGVIEAAMEPFLALLGQTLLATPQVTDNDALVGMWRGCLGLAGCGYVLLVMAGGLTLMGYETVQTRYALKQIAPRLVLGLVAATLSLGVMERAIALANALSAAIMARELDGTGRGMAQMWLGGKLSDSLLAAAPLNGEMHLLILALVLLVVIAGVILGYLVRAAMVALLAVAAPLALSCHALPQTETVARLWWRALAGCLVIQVAQSAALAVAVRLYFEPGNTVLGQPNPGQVENLLSALCLFWVLWKIPGWTTQVILRGTPAAVPHAPAPVRMLRTLAISMLLHRYLPRGRGTGTRTRRPAAPTARQGMQQPGPPWPGGGPRPGGGGGPAGSGPRSPGPATPPGGGHGPRPGRPVAAGPGGSTGPGGQPPTVTYEWGTPRARTPGNVAPPPGPRARPLTPHQPKTGAEAGQGAARAAAPPSVRSLAPVAPASGPSSTPSSRSGRTAAMSSPAPGPVAAGGSPVRPDTQPPGVRPPAPGTARGEAGRPVPRGAARAALRPVPMRLALEPARPARPARPAGPRPRLGRRCGGGGGR